MQPLALPPPVVAELEACLMLFYTGTQRNARVILKEQIMAIEHDEATLKRMQKLVELAYEMRDHLLAGRVEDFGLGLHRAWELKRGLSAAISTPTMDQYYERARAAGALGGKLTGAGGGGFLALYCPRSSRAKVQQAMEGLESLEFRFDWGGARIAFAQ